MTQPDRRDERLADERLREILAELCGDERNGGLIRDMAFTVWSNCHHPTHEDGNSDWGNDNLPLVNVANERVREVIAGLASELLRRREADEWQPIETAPHGTPVLLWKESTKETYVAAMLSGEHGPGWCTPDGYEIFRATRWRPLPAPPALKDPANDHH